MAQQIRIWSQLSMGVQDHVISFLDPNEIAGTVRLICKAAAARYSGPQHNRIRLSQRVPAHTFQHWTQPEATRSLSSTERDQLLSLVGNRDDVPDLKALLPVCASDAIRSLSYHQRRRLLHLTALSGSLRNLETLLLVVGLSLDRDVFVAAVTAGHLTVCHWLRAGGCPWDPTVLEAAGRSGSLPMCQWLIAAGCPDGAASALAGAARGGHVGLVDQLLASYGPPEQSYTRGSLLHAVAKGCDLPALRRLYAILVPEPAERVTELDVMMAAAGSPAPDWREKVQWLQAQGYPRSACASEAAARCPDALDRLTWLAGRGWPVNWEEAAVGAARRDDLATLQLALESVGTAVDRTELAETAASEAAICGQMGLLQHLHARGHDMKRACYFAAHHGHLHVVTWLVETLGAGAVLSEAVFTAAARSGSLPLLTWLRQQGCVYRDAGVLDAAVEFGASEEALEWLLAQGCELKLSADLWSEPADRGDLATLAWLRRMGCPWPEDAKQAAQQFLGGSQQFWQELGCTLPVLRWLVAAGCPFDAAEALRRARGGPPSCPGVLPWLERQCHLARTAPRACPAPVRRV